MADQEKREKKEKTLQPEHAHIQNISSTDASTGPPSVERSRREESMGVTPSQQKIPAKRPLHENDSERTRNEDRSFKQQKSLQAAKTMSAAIRNAAFPNKRLKSGNSRQDVFEMPSTPPTPSTVQPSAKPNDTYSTGKSTSDANYSIATNYDTANQSPPTPPPSAASTATNSSSLAPSESATPALDKRKKGDNIAPSISPRKTSVSSFDNGNSWTDDDAYESMPKTPVAPPPSSSKRKNLRQNTTSPLPSASGMFLPDVPPAPPTTPAAKAGVLPFSVDMGLATPLPYTAGFVQNANELEQRHRQTQQNLEQEQQQYRHEQHQQQDFYDGAVTPAPPRPQQQQQSNTAKPPLARSTTALSDDFSEWAVGDRYKLSRMLGRGSYGEVAQAIDLHQGRPDAYVAIKRIVGPFDQEVDAVRLFREIHILRRLRTLGKNDCIVPLLDVVQPPTDDLNDFHDLYLVFDYVDTDLYKLIMSPQYLTTEHIQTFLYQMLIGLKYIHSGNVIHRDLKPANILLNEDCSLKICDFGLARIVDETSVAHRKSNSSRNASNADESSSRSIPSRGQISPKKFLGRSCSISEQPLSQDDMNDIDTVTKLPLTRQLTKHVVTRWYRAPELILIQPYTTAVDVWSLGCIFAELLSMQEGSVPGYQDRTPLFPGGACYPLSGDTDNAERLDQLNVIFNVIGTPSEEDIAYMGGANEYVKTMKPIKPKNLRDIYPAANPNALDLLQKMLKFNPTERCTAGEALNHNFFAGIRREEMETTVETPMESPAFLNEQEIDIETLKQKAYNEVLWFRDNQRKNIATPTASSTTEAEKDIIQSG